MKRIQNEELLNHYLIKHDIAKLFDKAILGHVQLHFYQKEELILRAESELEYYYLLVDGKIKVSYLFENGKAMFLKFYSGFISIGDLELFKNKPVRCNVEAIEAAYLIAVPAPLLRKQYLDNVNFLHHLIDSLSDKLEATINNSSYNFIYPLVNRLASYLEEHVTDGDRVRLNASFQEIAQFLGTTYRHLNRTLKELEAEAVIRCEGKTVHILDQDRLRQLSKNLFLKPL